ncbi:hypothetical protein GY45DRAFT_323609 [Cubamyces sp. BRFM 1775]|nr:hypothetical protein GY45DRAFT_323609 [Cubamyces sp. BRFM 1775]
MHHPFLKPPAIAPQNPQARFIADFARRGRACARIHVRVRGGRAVRSPVHHVKLRRAEPLPRVSLEQSPLEHWHVRLVPLATIKPARIPPLHVPSPPRACGLRGFYVFSVVSLILSSAAADWRFARSPAVYPPGSNLPSIAVLAMMALHDCPGGSNSKERKKANDVSTRTRTTSTSLGWLGRTRCRCRFSTFFASLDMRARRHLRLPRPVR